MKVKKIYFFFLRYLMWRFGYIQLTKCKLSLAHLFLTYSQLSAETNLKFKGKWVRLVEMVHLRYSLALTQLCKFIVSWITIVGKKIIIFVEPQLCTARHPWCFPIFMVCIFTVYTITAPYHCFLPKMFKQFIL